MYVSNPSRHGKSLLLDNLFQNEAEENVCVLNVTYNDGTRSPAREDLISAVGALRGLLLRLLDDLVFKNPNWDDCWKHCPLVTAEDPVKVCALLVELCTHWIATYTFKFQSIASGTSGLTRQIQNTISFFTHAGFPRNDWPRGTQCTQTPHHH